MLGTSKNKQDSKSFELFITTAPIPNLNDKLTVFGRVIKGEDVVQVITREVFSDQGYTYLNPLARMCSKIETLLWFSPVGNRGGGHR